MMKASHRLLHVLELVQRQPQEEAGCGDEVTHYLLSQQAEGFDRAIEGFSPTVCLRPTRGPHGGLNPCKTLKPAARR